MADCYMCRNRYTCFKMIRNEYDECSDEKLLKRIDMTFSDFLYNDGFSWSIIDDYEYPDICKICPANDGDYCRLGECGGDKYDLECNIDMKNRCVKVFKK